MQSSTAEGDAPDTRKSSAITDHPFRPRAFRAKLKGTDVDRSETWAQPSPYLCGFTGCNLAEAAHAETTVKRDHIPSMVTLCKGEHPWDSQ
jgi:hypothetical protein